MSNKFISKRYIDLETSAMSSASTFNDIPTDLINMSIGDPDIDTDIKITELAFNDAKNGHTHYTNAYGYIELRDEIVEFYKNEYSMNIETNNIMITTSASHAMFLALETVLDDGDEVIIPEPYFTSYYNQVKLVRAKPITMPTYEKDNFNITIKELEKALTKKTKAIIINSPNNPTGVCYNIDTLNMIAKFAIDNNLIIFADDIYTSIIFNSKFIPIASLENMFERTITINSFSKNYAMTGWRIGSMIAPKYIIHTAREINEGVVFSAPSISQRAALYALKNRDAITNRIKTEFQKRAEYAYSRINSLKKLSVLKPQGSIYLFVNIKQSSLSSADFCNKLLKDAHILALPGNCFGESGEGYIRIALTIGVDKLKEAFDRMSTLDYCN